MSGYVYNDSGTWRSVNLDRVPTGTGAYRRIRTAVRSDPAALADLGVYPAARLPRPADTATTTFDRDGGTLTAGTVTFGWTERPKTADELDDDDRAADGAAIDAQVVARLTQIVDNIEGATVGQTQTAIKDLARLLRRIVRSQKLDQ